MRNQFLFIFFSSFFYLFLFYHTKYRFHQFYFIIVCIVWNFAMAKFVIKHFRKSLISSF